jgi:hypothetical protein
LIQRSLSNFAIHRTAHGIDASCQGCKDPRPSRRRRKARAACGRLPKLAPDQLDYARRMIGERIGRAQAARSLGVDRPTLRRLLMKGETW